MSVSFKTLETKTTIDSDEILKKCFHDYQQLLGKFTLNFTLTQDGRVILSRDVGVKSSNLSPVLRV